MVKTVGKLDEKIETNSSWTFLSNHAHVLVCLAADPAMRLRDVAQEVGITERAAQRIVSELEQAEILTRIRDGRRNRYKLHTNKPLRHPLESHCTIGSLLDMVKKINHDVTADSDANANKNNTAAGTTMVV